MYGIKTKIRLFLFRRQWRKNNKHNDTVPGNLFKMKNVFVGKGTYGIISIHSRDEKTKVLIGNYCSIAPNVMFIAGSDHFTTNLSTFPFKVKLCNEKSEAISKGDILIEDDVWIGFGSIILSGVKVGQGAIIAAGAVVSKDVPPYAIVGGVPAKIIKYRFNETIINKITAIDYSRFSNDLIRQNIDLLYHQLNDENVDSFIQLFPKKEK